MHPTIPLVDISSLLSPSASRNDVDQCARQMGQAFASCGFMLAQVPGLSSSLQCALQDTRALFQLEQHQKQALSSKNSPLRRGYTPVGGAHNCQAGQCDLKESFVMGAGPDMLLQGRGQHASGGECPTPFHGPNQWPQEEALPGWGARMRGCWTQLMEVSRALATGLALSLGLPADYFTSKMRDPVAQMLLVRYDSGAAGTEGCGAGEQQQGQQPQGQQQQGRQQQGRRLGCGEHSDCGFLTLLTCDTEGLEIRLPTGEWIAAPPVPPGALLVNLGDMAALWTAGRCLSTPHRVMLEPGAGPAHRHSLVFFCNCDFEAPVTPSDCLLAAAQPGAATEGQPGGSGGGGTGGSGGGAADAVPGGMTAGRYMLDKLGIMWDDPLADK